MNAATVSGPRSRTRSARRDSGFGTRDSMARSSANAKSPNPESRLLATSVLLDRDERLSVATPDQNLRDAARGNFLKLSRGFRGVRHRPAIDREDHVAAAERARRRAVWIDLRHDRAGLTRRQLEPPRHLRRHVVERDAKTARILLVR